MHPCQCQSSLRRIALVLGHLAETHSEVQALLQRFGWEWDESLATAVVEVGPGCQFAGVAELHDFVSGALGPRDVAEVRAAWIEPGKLSDQTRALLNAKPLRTFAPSQDSPLAELLESRAIETWFQPIICANDGRVWGHECLMRAHHPETGALISPATILKWAEQENLLFMLDRVCRETHIANAAAADTSTDGVFLINFMPSVIYEPEFCLRTTMNALEQTALEPSRIIFEVVETESIRDHDHLKGILQYYRDNGFRVALDDLAAGYSGLTLMAELQPDLIKIDRGIISRAVASEAYREVCEAIISLARTQKKQVLAEGVETAEELALMQSFGVDLLQGYLFGKPDAIPAQQSLHPV